MTQNVGVGNAPDRPFNPSDPDWWTSFAQSWRAELAYPLAIQRLGRADLAEEAVAEAFRGLRQTWITYTTWPRSVPTDVVLATRDAVIAVIRRHYGPRLRAQAASIVGPDAADDVVQEALINLFTRDMGPAEGLEHYLAGVIRNASMDWLRRQHPERQGGSLDVWHEQHPDRELPKLQELATPEDVVMWNEDRARLARALKRSLAGLAPGDQRLVMRYHLPKLLGLPRPSRRELAQELEVREDTTLHDWIARVKKAWWAALRQELDAEQLAMRKEAPDG